MFYWHIWGPGFNLQPSLRSKQSNNNTPLVRQIEEDTSLAIGFKSISIRLYLMVQIRLYTATTFAVLSLFLSMASFVEWAALPLVPLWLGGYSKSAIVQLQYLCAALYDTTHRRHNAQKTPISNVTRHRTFHVWWAAWVIRIPTARSRELMQKAQVVRILGAYIKHRQQLAWWTPMHISTATLQLEWRELCRLDRRNEFSILMENRSSLWPSNSGLSF